MQKRLHLPVKLYSAVNCSLRIVQLNRFPRPEDLRVEDIEGLAVELRRHWGLGIGAIPNVIQLLEARGVTVFELGGAVEKSVDAFSARIRAGRPRYSSV